MTTNTSTGTGRTPGATTVRRFSTETKSALKTTELIACVDHAGQDGR